MLEHLLRMKDLRNQLSTINNPIGEYDMVSLIISSFPLSFELLVFAFVVRETKINANGRV